MRKINIIKFPIFDNPLNYDAFVNSIKNADGSWFNGISECGIIKSRDFDINLFIANKKTRCNVYAANVTNGISSFCHLIKHKTNIKIEIKYKEKITHVEIFNVVGNKPKYVVKNNKLITSLTCFSSYTFVFNKDFDKSLTIFVEKPKINRINKHAKIYKPGVHDFPIIAEENTNLTFKAGFHKIQNIILNSNVNLIFEDGAYLECINPSKEKETPFLDPDWTGMTRFVPVISSKNSKNISISGNAIIDLSKIGFHARGGINLENCKNVNFKDFMLNNCPEWSITIACCKNIKVSNVKIYGYRQNSDGFAFVDSHNCIINNCFARSGDDLFEVKSMYENCDIATSKIYFKNCVGWPDKCRGFGIIAETKKDIENIYYKNCCIIDYKSTWMDALGSLIIYVENNGHISNIFFENISIFHTVFYPINITLAKNSKGTISNIFFNNIKFYDLQKIRIKNDSNSTMENILFKNIYYKNKKILNKNFLSKEGVIKNIKFE